MIAKTGAVFRMWRELHRFEDSLIVCLLTRWPWEVFLGQSHSMGILCDQRLLILCPFPYCIMKVRVAIKGLNGSRLGTYVNENRSPSVNKHLGIPSAGVSTQRVDGNAKMDVTWCLPL